MYTYRYTKYLNLHLNLSYRSCVGNLPLGTASPCRGPASMLQTPYLIVIKINLYLYIRIRNTSSDVYEYDVCLYDIKYDRLRQRGHKHKHERAFQSKLGVETVP